MVTVTELSIMSSLKWSKFSTLHSKYLLLGNRLVYVVQTTVIVVLSTLTKKKLTSLKLTVTAIFTALKLGKGYIALRGLTSKILFKFKCTDVG